MASKLQRLTVRYLYQVLEQEVECTSIPAPKGVKIGVANHYDFAKMSLYGQDFLLCEPKEDRWTPMRITKDFMQIPDACPILLTGNIAAASRFNLIQRGINFIDPGKQLHLPHVLLCLSDIGIRRHYTPRHRESLSPAAQCVLLSFYQDRDHADKTVIEHTKALGYSKMTLHRTIRELVSKKLLKPVPDLEMGCGLDDQVAHPAEEGFLSILHHLQSPISKIYYLAEFPPVIAAECVPTGESAMASVSDLIPPRLPQYAIGKKQASKHKLLLTECVTSQQGDAIASLQVWSYSPFLTVSETAGTAPEVDKLSLYLSLYEQADERLESALEQLLHTVTWFKD